MFRRTIVLILCVFGEVAAQNDSCGIQAITPLTSPSRVVRVVGGQQSRPHSWPWMVLLRYGTHDITCGGAIVRGSDGALVVVTAGHCIDSYSRTPSDWKIDVGLHSRSAKEPDQVEYGVGSLVIHPNFDPQFLDDDIAIVKPSTPIVENDHVSPICLTANDSNTMAGQTCVIAGWGSTHQAGQPVDTLHEVYKPILTDVSCNSALNVFGYDGDAMLCAGNLTHGGVDSCSWDSGAPFACKNSDGRWEMVGISSWGYGCAQPGYPGVYTEVFKFTQWIHENSHTSGSFPAVG